MGPYIEANSLSDITQIASNPPKYPRNPTETPRQPLTLYIARVPGSRDIILTTLKPQLKNVTAEDVASSLYYLHLNTEDDARLWAEVEENATAERAEPNTAIHKPLPRKPLQETATPSADLSRPEEFILSRPAVQITQEHVQRKPLPVPAGSSLDLNRSEQVLPSGQRVPSPIPGRDFQRKEVTSHVLPPQPHDPAKETVQKRPLGPRTLQSEATVRRQPISGVQNPSPTSRTHPLDSVTSVSIDSVQSGVSSYDGVNTGESTKSFLITIIRRDPSSGAQWNIGSIIGDSQGQEANNILISKKPHFDMSVHLTTPGYAPFVNPQSRSFYEKMSPLKSKQVAAKDSVSPNVGFDRQVRMEGSSIWDRASQQHKQSRSDILATHAETCMTTDVLSGVMREDSIADNRDSSAKGYGFLSPWGGKCKFSTGGVGRSLRCKHTLPESLSSSNAVFESPGAAVVSELRFNLPHSAVFKAHAAVRSPKKGVVESGRFSGPKFGHIRNKSSQDSRPSLPLRPHRTSYAAMYPSDDEEPPPLPPRAYADQRMADSNDEQESTSISARAHSPTYASGSPNDEDNKRLDLSIGQEKAGGGNRGKRAKLGKLIIHDEGFKMLDLVVAANMGVWWNVWGSDHR